MTPAPVLDAWALLAYLQGEDPAAGRVDKVLDGGEACASWVNLGEVLYIVAARRSPAEAERTVRELAACVDPLEASAERVLAAARLKAAHRLSYADAFAVAAAAELKRPLWTGDPEILAADLDIEAIDLRR